MTADARMRVAILDSDSGFVQVLRKRLDVAGSQCRVVPGPVPLDAVAAMRVHAVIVDLAVCGHQAWTFLENLCARLPGLAVVVCTGQSTVAQRVRALRLGADDWVTKPCHPEEVVARVEAIVRRRRRGAPRTAGRVLAVGQLEIRPDRFQAFAAGTSLELTRREFELLHLLAEADGQVLPREAIYEAIWGYQMAHGDRSIDVFVRKLRLKLKRGSPQWRYIHTHFGVGYRFGAQPVAAAGPSHGRASAGARPSTAADAGDVGRAERTPLELPPLSIRRRRHAETGGTGPGLGLR